MKKVVVPTMLDYIEIFFFKNWKSQQAQVCITHLLYFAKVSWASSLRFIWMEFCPKILYLISGLDVDLISI